jgi:hypothetical protein
MVLATIHHPWYDINGRKYIDLLMNEKVVRVKIPFRYNRVMCFVHGITPIQSLTEGTHVECTFDIVQSVHVLRSITPQV